MVTVTSLFETDELKNLPFVWKEQQNYDNFRFWLNYHCSKTTFICLSASHLFVLTADFAQPYWTGTTDALNATLSAHVLWG